MNLPNILAKFLHKGEKEYSVIRVNRFHPCKYCFDATTHRKKINGKTIPICTKCQNGTNKK